MTDKLLIAGGCSFTYGSELSDVGNDHTVSKKTWAYLLRDNDLVDDYICTAKPGSGNDAIARRTFRAVADLDPQQIACVTVMWTFVSRYDWAMPRHKLLDQSRWAYISPWDTSAGQLEAYRTLAGSEIQQQAWANKSVEARETGVKPFAEAIYRYAANDYHETFLSWKSIIWLQNILEKKNIPYFFTLADNSLFYNEFEHKKDQDGLFQNLYKEINFTNWFSFGERMMGFNQWAMMNNYDRGSTHPLDKAHQDAVKLMKPKYKEIIGAKK